MFANRGKDKTMQEQQQQKTFASRANAYSACRHICTWYARHLEERGRRKKRLAGNGETQQQTNKLKEAKKECFSFHLKVKLNLSLDGIFPSLCHSSPLRRSNSRLLHSNWTLPLMYYLYEYFWYFALRLKSATVAAALDFMHLWCCCFRLFFSSELLMWSEMGHAIRRKLVRRLKCDG